ncbi:MAG: aminotransferase class III-fold pyridoxal phosphate-dependent enzyme [Candidatus Bathyarchaeota archaeon]|nr:MAG: aminotransferase class III-fold pyridoxal phosphate-dependent enzyme [Candidatus Bathyarchaeota archaeon]
MLEEALKEFFVSTPKSRQLYERALRLMPGGISHNIRTWSLPSVGAYPFYVKKAKGCHIWDVDDNKYVDYWMGHMAMILGHNPKPVVTALQDQLTITGGTHWGTVNEKQLELAELIKDMVPTIDMLRFCNTGSEATMYATRLARGYTKKRILVKEFGGWHGYNDVLNWYVNEPQEDENESLGQIHELCDYVKAVPFGDIDKTIEAIRRNKNDLAAMILDIKMHLIKEGDCPKVAKYIKAVKEELNKYGALLIIDEIITGFRLAQGGVQEYFGVNADLVTYGKILGGGLPIGCVGGREDIMCLADPTEHQAGLKKKSEIVWIGGGTFSANPVTMTAGVETLKILRRKKTIYDELEIVGRRLRSKLNKILKETGISIDVYGIQSAFMPDLTRLNQKSILEWNIRLFNKGLFGRFPRGYISSAHTRDDIEKYITAVDEIKNEMKTKLT